MRWYSLKGFGTLCLCGIPGIERTGATREERTRVDLFEAWALVARIDSDASNGRLHDVTGWRGRVCLASTGVSGPCIS
jgi:hypothetical protein